jgi:hypothetical protein
MKIETSILPRRDGTLTARLNDGTVYSFAHDETGAFVTEVIDEAHIAELLLRGGLFAPTNIEDIEYAGELINTEPPEGNAETDADPDDEGDDYPVDLNAAPIEEPASAVSAPAPVRVGRPKKAK